MGKVKFSQLDDKARLEKLLKDSLHYYDEDYDSTYCNRIYNCSCKFLKKIGLGAYKIAQIVHPLEAAYKFFWEKRDLNKISDRIAEYVRKFLKEYNK